MRELSAVYVTGRNARTGQTVTLRVGVPCSWSVAQARWLRLDNRRRDHGVTFTHHGRRYRVQHVEVRTVGTDGVGLGSSRHARAQNVSVREYARKAA